MKTADIYKLLFYVVEDKDLASVVGWLPNALPDESHSLKSLIDAKIEALGNAELPRAAGCNDTDLKFIEFAVSILEYQSIKTLMAKISNLPREQKDYGENKFPDNIHEGECLKWAREPSWTLIEAAFLSVGIVPNAVLEYDFQRTEKILVFTTSPLIEELTYRYELLQKHSYDSCLHNASPAEFLYWFRSMELSIPKELDGVVKRLQSKRDIYGELVVPSEKVEVLKPLERSTLLKLIAAMSIRGYGYNPNANRNQATSDIQSDLDFLGIGLDPKTILKWLREATAQIDEDNFS